METNDRGIIRCVLPERGRSVLMRLSIVNIILCRECMKGERERRRKQLLDGLKETRGYRKYRTLWRTRFGRGYGPVVIQATVE